MWYFDYKGYYQNIISELQNEGYSSSLPKVANSSITTAFTKPIDNTDFLKGVRNVLLEEGVKSGSLDNEYSIGVLTAFKIH